MLKLRYVLPVSYVALATYVWIDFAHTAKDGLANIGLLLAVFPVTILGLFLGWLAGEETFVLLPSRFGYLADHAVFYVPSAAAVAAGLWLVGRWFDRRT